MGPGYFVLAIMGCADGSSACTPVTTVPTRFETEAACAAAAPEALLANSSFDFPSLLAQCRPAKVPAAAPRTSAPHEPGATRSS